MVYTDHLRPELRTAEALQRMDAEARLVAQREEWEQDAWGMTPAPRARFEVLLAVPTGGDEILLLKKRPNPTPRGGQVSPNVKAIPLIVLGVLLNAAAQICLKKGLQAAGGMQLALGPLFRLMLEPWVIAGLACYAVSVVVWLGALSLVQVNYAYPFLALGFIANALMARAFLGEAMTPMRWLALGVIVVGVGLQALSGRGQ